MKKIALPILILSCLFVFANCDKGEENIIDYAYHAHIHSPTSASKNLNDTIHIEVEFESHTGEAVHHLNVRIYNKTDNTEVYSQPGEAELHEVMSDYEFHEELVLSEINGFYENSTWILEVSIWGADTNEGLEVETMEFYIAPQ